MLGLTLLVVERTISVEVWLAFGVFGHKGVLEVRDCGGIVFLFGVCEVFERVTGHAVKEVPKTGCFLGGRQRTVEC